MRWKPVHSVPVDVPALADVDLDVELAEALGDRLDPLVVPPRVGIEPFGQLDVTGTQRVGEDLVSPPGLGCLPKHVAAVGRDTVGELPVGVAPRAAPVTARPGRMPSPAIPGLHASCTARRQRDLESAA